MKRRPFALNLNQLEARDVPATFTVSTTADSGPGSLRAAVDLANANPDADTIVFSNDLANQTITLTSDTNDAKVSANNRNTRNNELQVVYGRTGLAITTDVTIDGAAAANLQISGNSLRRHFVVAGNNALTAVNGAKLTLINLTVKDGLAAGGQAVKGGGGAGLGGAVFVDDGGSLTINRVTFTQNRSKGGDTFNNYVGGGLISNFSGGGMSHNSERLFGGGLRHGASNFNQLAGFGGGGTSLPIIANPFLGLFSPTTGGFGGGGGVNIVSVSIGGFGAGAAVGTSPNTKFSRTNVSGWGGGLGDYGPGNPGVIGGGGAGMGGAIFAYNGNVSIANSTFEGNTARGSNRGQVNSDRSSREGKGIGGAIFNLGGTMTITGSKFNGNQADDKGGAIFNAPQIGKRESIENTDFTVEVGPATMLIANCIIDNNRSNFGAAVYNGGKLTSPDSTLENNEAAEQGGAYFNAEGGELIIVNDKMLNNQAGKDGGGIANFGTLTLRDALLDDNEAERRNGGGLANFGTAHIDDTQFMNNDAGLDGGGISNGTGATLNLSGTSLLSNHADHNGGAIHDRGIESFEEEQMIGNTAGNAGGGFFEVAGQNEADAGTPPALFGDGNYDTGVPETILGDSVGNGGRVRVRNQATNTIVTDIDAYGDSYTGGVNVAHGWLTDADGVPHEAVVTAVISRGGPLVKVFDQFTGRELKSFFAYDPSFTGGVNIAVGDVNGDGLDDIIAAAGVRGGPQVKVFDGATYEVIRNFFAYDAAFRGGVNVAVGDVNGDGVADIVTAPQSGGGPHVKVFDGTDLHVQTSFFAYASGIRGGVNLAVGDLDNDGTADIVTAPGAGGGPMVKIFDANGTVTEQDFTEDASFRAGLDIALSDIDDDGTLDILTSYGNGSRSEIVAFDINLDPKTGEDFFDFDLGLTGGVQLG